jgi:hypothetical protein
MPDDPEVKPSFEHGDAVFSEVMTLHEKLAAVDPELVVALSFGSRKKGPKQLGGLGNDKLPKKFMDEKKVDPTTADTFRNYWSDESTGGFANVFDKFGDGFINVHTLAE